MVLTRVTARIGVRIMADNRQDALGSHRDRPLDEAVIREFSSKVRGQLIRPKDDAYDEARAVFYGGIERHPAFIVRVADATDVSRVVALARESGLDLAVRSGGHSPAGHSTTEGGIILDLSEMKGLEIDLERRTAWAQTGLTTGEYTAAAGAHGLATGFGDTGSVGVGGITLGGGVGYLVRKHGLTIDDLLAADVVNADGELLRADAETHPDLFWAIRGGGGNFGVATRFQYRLHEVDTIVGGMLILPATPEVVASFVAEAEAAPEELSAIANVMTAPPMPFLPAETQGQLIIMAMLVYAGDVEAGERAIAPFRGLAEPIADMVKPMPYPDVGFLGEEGEARVRDAYPGSTWKRLAEIKDRYDPTNLFRLNQNIPPATHARTIEN
jgi:FAD/FMN-containing dehydrogenase